MGEAAGEETGGALMEGGDPGIGNGNGNGNGGKGISGSPGIFGNGGSVGIGKPGGRVIGGNGKMGVSSCCSCLTGRATTWLFGKFRKMVKLITMEMRLKIFQEEAIFGKQEEDEEKLASMVVCMYYEKKKERLWCYI